MYAWTRLVPGAVSIPVRDYANLMIMSPFNHIYEFPYVLRNQQCLVRFTSVTGHLMGLDFEQQHKKWHSCPPAELFSAPIKKNVSLQSQSLIAQTLEIEARQCQWLILWLDCDREGENISFEVIEVCTRVNRNLDVWRARFSAVVDREIRNALANLVRPNKNESDAVDARMEIDLRIGSAFTRWQTLFLQRAFDFQGFADRDKGPLLSYGPCQFPTLGFIVERHWEIQQHVPESFWAIDVRYEQPGAHPPAPPGSRPSARPPSAKFNWARGRLFDSEAALIIYEMCVEEPEATVTQVGGRQSLKHPPHPLNTIEMQKRASRYLHLGAEQALKLAEELYQEGFLSYPRTETDQFVEGTNLHGIVEGHVAHHDWGGYAHRLLADNKFQWPRGGGHDDQAHPPIHPTRCSTPQEEGNWSREKKLVYEMVCRHFLSCVSPPAVGMETTVEIDIAGEQFTARGLMVKERNWLEVYKYESWSGNANLPLFEEGMRFTPTEMMLTAGQTQPPTYLHEADLLSLMDRHGIGTDATMAQHIEKQIDRCYAVKEGQPSLFKPTKLGEALVTGYAHMDMKNMWRPVLRSVMERNIAAVARGQMEKAAFLQGALSACEQEFRNATNRQILLKEAVSQFFERREGGNAAGGDGAHAPGIIGHVPVCKCTREICRDGRMYLQRSEGQSGIKHRVSCNKYPECRNTLWLPSTVVEADVSDECASCSRPQQPVYQLRMKLRSRGFPPTFRDMVEPTGNEAGMLNLVGCVFGCNHRIRDWFDAMSDRGGGGGGAGPTRGGAARGNSNPRGRTANAGRATAQRGGARGVAGGRGGAQAPAGRGSGRGNSGSDVAQAPVRRRGGGRAGVPRSHQTSHAQGETWAGADGSMW